MIDVTTNPKDAAPVDARRSLSVDGWRRDPLPAWSKVAVGLLGLLCFMLTLSGSWHRDIGFDEDIDHQATIGLRENPLIGNGINGSQARLPHYATLLTYRIAETLGWPGMLEWNIVIARGVSSAAAALTVLFIFLLGLRASGITAGLAAAATLSIAPYFLGFGGLAYTNGDAFCPLLATATIWAYVRSVDDPRGWRLATLAMCIGLAVASKFLLVMLLPGLVLADLLTRREAPNASRSSSPSSVSIRSMVLMSLAAFAFSFGTMMATRVLAPNTGDASEPYRIAGWLIASVLTIAGLYRFKDLDGRSLNWLLRWVMVLPLAAAVSLAFFPEHVLHFNVMRELLHTAATANEIAPLQKIRDFLLIYGGVTLLKLGLPLGILTCCALVWACVASRRSLVIRASLMVCVAYALFLIAQPLKQTFYPMTVYPLMILMTLLFIERAYLSLWPRARWVAMALLVLAYGWLIVGVARVYPHFHYYGYETIGPSWRGYETRGFVGLFFIDQEGNREALEWCAKNLPPQTRVVSALRMLSSVERTMKATPHDLNFVQLDWPWLRKKESDWEIIRTADYFILHLNNRINDRATPTPERLAEIFESDPIHTVYSGHGAYQIPVVEIFKRKKSLP